MTDTLVKNESGTLKTNETSRSDVQFNPRADIFEDENNYVIECDLPGVRSEDLELQRERGELTLYGKVQPRNSKGLFIGREYRIGDFRRSFTLGNDIDSDGITAQLKHGVVTIQLPKRAEVKPKKIAIHEES